MPVSLIQVKSEEMHKALVEFCAKNNATTIVVAKEDEGETRFAGIVEQSPARKNEIKGANRTNGLRRFRKMRKGRGRRCQRDGT